MTKAVALVACHVSGASAVITGVAHPTTAIALCVSAMILAGFLTGFCAGRLLWFSTTAAVATSSLGRLLRVVALAVDGVRFLGIGAFVSHLSGLSLRGLHCLGEFQHGLQRQVLLR